MAEKRNNDIKQDKNTGKIILIVIIIFSIFGSILEEIFLNSDLGFTFSSIFGFIMPVAFWIFVIFIIVTASKNKGKETTQNKDIFDENIKVEIFNTHENIKQQQNNAEKIKDTEVIIEKPNKECAFCGAKNPTSSKFCDCCGKKL